MAYPRRSLTLRNICSPSGSTFCYATSALVRQWCVCTRMETRVGDWKGSPAECVWMVFSRIASVTVRAGHAWELLIDVMKESAKRSVGARLIEREEQVQVE